MHPWVREFLQTHVVTPTSVRMEARATVYSVEPTAAVARQVGQLRTVLRRIVMQLVAVRTEAPALHLMCAPARLAGLESTARCLIVLALVDV